MSEFLRDATNKVTLNAYNYTFRLWLATRISLAVKYLWNFHGLVDILYLSVDKVH